MLRFRVRLRPRKLSKVEGLGSGPEGRLKRLTKNVTALIRHERIESTYPQCDETRGYAEKLIQMAVRNGDKDKHTMEMADYWLLEKDLIHKLFKVLVPRYSSFPATATSIHRISGTFPGRGVPQGVLELKGNPWPPVRPQPRNTSLMLHNILLREAKNDYRKERQAAMSSGPATPPAASSSSFPSSSSSSSSSQPSSSSSQALSSSSQEPPSSSQSSSSSSKSSSSSESLDAVGPEGSSVDGVPDSSVDGVPDSSVDGKASDKVSPPRS